MRKARLVLATVALAGAWGCDEGSNSPTAPTSFFASGASTVAVGEAWTGIGQGCSSAIEWLAPEGSPASGQGGRFVTSWSQAGVKSIEASCSATGEFQSIGVTVRQGRSEADCVVKKNCPGS